MKSFGYQFLAIFYQNLFFLKMVKTKILKKKKDEFTILSFLFFSKSSLKKSSDPESEYVMKLTTKIKYI